MESLQELQHERMSQEWFFSSMFVKTGNPQKPPKKLAAKHRDSDPVYVKQEVKSSNRNLWSDFQFCINNKTVSSLKRIFTSSLFSLFRNVIKIRNTKSSSGAFNWSFVAVALVVVAVALVVVVAVVVARCCCCCCCRSLLLLLLLPPLVVAAVVAVAAAARCCCCWCLPCCFVSLRSWISWLEKRLDSLGQMRRPSASTCECQQMKVQKVWTIFGLSHTSWLFTLFQPFKQSEPLS